MKRLDVAQLADCVVLVIAPHPDDDVIGCGGTLSRAAARGCDVRAIYVTDGSASHIRSQRFPPAVLARIREREAENALQVLGVRRAPVFLQASDGALASAAEAETERLVEAISALCDAGAPRAVFAPWSRDPHTDHVATARIVSRALRRTDATPEVLLYSVWLSTLGRAPDLPAAGEVATVEVRLTGAEVAQKRKAILQHVSQTTRLIDDDPDGFRIDDRLLETWLVPVERFYRTREPHRARSTT